MSSETQDIFVADMSTQGVEELIDVKPMVEAVESLQSSLDSFYSTYELPKFDIDVIRNFSPEDPIKDEEDFDFASTSLKQSNYSLDVLKTENIVLFSEPVFLSRVKCTGIPVEENMSSLQLISQAGTPKKTLLRSEIVTEERAVRLSDSGIIKKTISVSIYNSSEVVLGVVLPKNGSVQTIKLAKVSSVLSDSSLKIEELKSAIQTLTSTSLRQKQQVAQASQHITSSMQFSMKNLEDLERKIGELKQQEEFIQQSINRSTLQLESVNNDVAKRMKELDANTISIETSLTKLAQIKERTLQSEVQYEAKNSELQRAKKELDETEISLGKVKSQLADAHREKNLTSLDIAGHSSETGKQVKLYSIFACLVFSGIVAMAVYIYYNGEGFVELLPKLKDASSWDIFLSRLPLVTATALIIGGLTSLFFYLVKNIVALNTEKMTMLKAEILAQQITDSNKCQNMSEQEKLDYRRDTKIKLITEVFNGKAKEHEIDSSLLVDLVKAAVKK
ncbi:hypothetical protein L1D14_06595 [Vibrio tubiashii]|uniref:hypothetical protein n=1 Tax=Vibrio tubiashii TaxID=29498 RepID=UPI001EFC6CEA|nr:hypothetical protein [Vibrio tubiashii]MCG9575909.1 hypothetical protein [Vibrio tubiashii]